MDSFLASVLENPHPDTMANPVVEVFKVWPTFSDQTHFTASMTSDSLVQLKRRYHVTWRHEVVDAPVGAMAARLRVVHAARDWPQAVAALSRPGGA